MKSKSVRRFLIQILVIEALMAFLLSHSAPAQGPVIVSSPCIVPVYLCNGDLQYASAVQFAIYDSNYLIDGNLTADSLVMRGDSNFYQITRWIPQSDAKIYGLLYAYGAKYAPAVFGTDTFFVALYYEYQGHTDSSKATFTFSPLPSPDVGLLGVTTFDCWFPGPDSAGSIGGQEGWQFELVTDTIHDIMNEGTPYNSPFSAQKLGENTRACLNACAGAIVDSITFESDFSEFTFLDLPSFPAIVPPGDSLVLHYKITPSIIGTHKRPMVFHVHGADPLVWSFEYSVQSSSSVQPVAASPTALRLYPNPLSSMATIYYSLDVEQSVSLSVYSVLGQKVWERTVQEEGAGSHLEEIDLAGLPDGVYYLRAGLGTVEVQSVKFVKE